MPQPSSRLVLPVSRRVFWLRTLMVLLLDASLATGGVLFFLKYQDRRAAASEPAVAAKTEKAPPEKQSMVEVEAPKVVKRGKKGAGSREQASRAQPTANRSSSNPSNPSSNPNPPPPVAGIDAAPVPVAVPAVIDAGLVAVTPPPGAADAASVVVVDDTAADERAARIGELIRDTMREGRDQIDKCYERAAKVDTKGLAGTIELELTILPTGATDGVRVVENDTGSEELGACLAALLRSWKFPSPGGEAIEFLWPFVFRGR